MHLTESAAYYVFNTPTALTPATPCTITLSGFNNTFTPGAYSSVISAQRSPTPTIDTATTSALTFADVSNNSVVSTTIDPTFTFSVGGHSGACNGTSQTAGIATSASSVSFPHITSGIPAVGAQDLSVITNAGSGFSVYVKSTGPLTDGVHTIAAVGGSNATPAAFPSASTEAFGYTTDAASLGVTNPTCFNGTNKWAAFETTSREVLTGASVGSGSGCIAMKVQVAPTTAAGTYTASLVYTAVPAF